MRSEGFPFIVWGSGGWTRVRFVCCVPARCPLGRVVNSVPWGFASRACRVCGVACVVCVALCHGDCCWAGRVGAAVPWGLASRACRVCGVSGAVPWVGVSRGWRWAMGIPGGRVACVALCHGDCYWACRVGGAVLWGLLLGVSRGCRVGGAMLLTRASSGWRRVLGIADQGVVWVAPCLWELVGVSRGWRRVLGIADTAFVWVAPCLGACW